MTTLYLTDAHKPTTGTTLPTDALGRVIDVLGGGGFLETVPQPAPERCWYYHRTVGQPPERCLLTDGHEPHPARRGGGHMYPSMAEATPTCDICGQPEDQDPTNGREYDWNGETGNHASCEYDGHPAYAIPGRGATMRCYDPAPHVPHTLCIGVSA